MRPPRATALPEGLRVALDPRTRLWAEGALATGGSPWKLVRIAPAARPFLAELRAAGERGAVPPTGVARAVGRHLLDHGLAHPIPSPRGSLTGRQDIAELVTVVIPAYVRADTLHRCLAALTAPGDGMRIIVVDDGSPHPAPIAAAAGAHGAELLRLPVNQGPAAARNAGLRAVRTPFVALVDSDCEPEKGWLDVLLPHFDDPRLAVVAPRVLPRIPDGGRGMRLLARHEAARSALDMGERQALVRPGATLGFLPSATLLLRTAAVRPEAADSDSPELATAFAEHLRLGEDVDFVWRLADQGWNVRYEPRAHVVHEPRLRPVEWARRRYEYGTSAADLAARHPGRLTPFRPSPWNAATLALLAARRPALAAACFAGSAGLLCRRFPDTPDAARLAATVVGTGVLADGAALGHVLRREWWPLGAAVLAAAGSRRMPAPLRRGAGAAATAMLAPIALEWLRHRPQVDPVRYTALRLLEDAAYGSGVIASAVRARSLAPLRPAFRRAPRTPARTAAGASARTPAPPA